MCALNLIVLYLEIDGFAWLPFHNFSDGELEDDFFTEYISLYKLNLTKERKWGGQLCTNTLHKGMKWSSCVSCPQLGWWRVNAGGSWRKYGWRWKRIVQGSRQETEQHLCLKLRLQCLSHYFCWKIKKYTVRGSQFLCLPGDKYQRFPEKGSLVISICLSIKDLEEGGILRTKKALSWS